MEIISQQGQKLGRSFFLSLNYLHKDLELGIDKLTKMFDQGPIRYNQNWHTGHN